MEQQQMQVQQQIHAEEMQDKEANRQVEVENNVRDNETKILVEKMKIQGGLMEETAEGKVDVVADIIEMEKIKQKDREMAMKLGLESDKLDLEREKISIEKARMISDNLINAKKLLTDKEINDAKLAQDYKKTDKQVKSSEKITDKTIESQEAMQDKDLEAKKELEAMKGRIQEKIAKLKPKPKPSK
jgi:hypothetical protein